MERIKVISFVTVLMISVLVFIKPVCDAKVRPGDLDISFGTNGRVITDFGGQDEAYAVAFDTQSRIVVAGHSKFGPNCVNYDCFALARYNIDGSLDATFGTNGKVTTAFDQGGGLVYALAIDSEGRIVVAGNASGAGMSDVTFALARYNTDGSLDTTFGNDGMVTTGFGLYTYGAARAIAIDSQGKLIVAGHTGRGDIYRDFALARYNSDGSLDTTFGTDGKVTTDIRKYDYLYALAIDSSGKIVVGGSTQFGGIRDFALARYNPDGSLDTTFGIDGKAITDFNASDEEIYGLAIDSQGRTVAAGFTTANTAGYTFALTRYNTDGSLDTEFGNDGKVTTSFSDYEDTALGIAIDSNEKIIAVGTASWYDLALARYNTDGSLDTEFGTSGKVTTDFGGYDAAEAVVIDSGKIIVVGFRHPINPEDGTDDFVLARYLAGETNPPTGSITINEGTVATKSAAVTLTLTASDDTPGPIKMCISNTTTCSSWTPFAETTDWALTSGNETKTVYVWFKDVWGNVNDVPYLDTIILDTKPPADGTVTATPGDTQVTLDWSGFDDALSGIGNYIAVFAEGSAPLSCSEGKLLYAGSDTSYIHAGLSNGAKYGYRVCAADNAGNVSSGATTAAKPRPESNPPAGSIAIKKGAEATTSTIVKLTLTASDDSPGPIKMCISNKESCTAWTAFAETMTWTLKTDDEDGIKTVNVWFKDIWGNVNSAPYSDTIILDTVAPANGTVTPTPSYGMVLLTWTGFTDTGSDIGNYKVVFSRGGFPAASCASGKQVYKGPDTNFVHSGLINGTVYYYRVCAIDKAGNISTGKKAIAKPQ